MDPLFDSEKPPETGTNTTRHRGELDEAIAALSDGWAEGDTPRVEALLDRIPPVGRSDLLELVYHEYCLADAMGAEPVAEDYYGRFPHLRSDLERLIGLHEVIDRSHLDSLAGRPAELPEPDDEVGPFHLLRELGKGGMAKVFLAEQSDLEHRLVVVKIATRPSLEAALLARAQHPHIVPVIRQASADGGSLHLIAMPFLGGASLAAVLAERASHGGRLSGKNLLAALDRAAAPEFTTNEGQSPIRAMISRHSHARAVGWMIARLADGLDHAGRLGVTHGDLKPANILIAADGRPMLLDFNLAVDWRSSDAELTGVAGGTQAYMAPERLRALAHPKSAPITRPADRQKADLYSLGLVLREALSGRSPEVPRDYPLLREAAERLAQVREHADPHAWCSVPGIPASIRPILVRLLAPDPADRYPGMAELAEDLNLWVANRPLLHVREEAGPMTRVTRWSKRYRVPLALGTVAIVVASLVALGSRALTVRLLRSQAEMTLATHWDSGDPSIFRIQRFDPWQSEGAADELAHRNLDHYAVLGPNDWRQRQDVVALGDADRADLEMWLMEQTWRLTTALSARVDATEDWQRALSLLERTPEWASLTAFENLRAKLRLKLRDHLDLPPSQVGKVVPAPWLEAYAAGLESEDQNLELAARCYTQVLKERPDAFWPLYRSAVVASRRSDHERAAEYLARCTALRPANPALWTLRAGSLLGMVPGASKTITDTYGEALRCCDQAIFLNPDFRDAYFVRCVVRARLNLVEGLQEDMDRFTRLSKSQGRIWSMGLSWILEELAGRDDVRSANTEDVALQEIIAEQLHRLGKKAEAIAAYDKVLTAEPDHLVARFGRACLLASDLRNEGMNEFAAIVEHAKFEELVRARDTSLIAFSYLVENRLIGGNPQEARQLAKRFLELALSLPLEGETESPMVGEAYYSLARVEAKEYATDPQAATRAAELLEHAGRSDARLLEERFLKDPYFNAARESINEALRELRARFATSVPGADARSLMAVPR